jgi:hypothetical protein
MPYSAMRGEGDRERQTQVQDLVARCARPYALSTQGHIWVAVMDGRFPDLGAVLHRNQYKKFVTFKYSEKVTAQVVTKPLQLLGKRALARAAAAAKPVTDKVKPLHHVGKQFPTWKVDMLYVYEVFGAKRQGWNREYEAARKIFESATVRGVVKAQHAMLYGGTGAPGMTNVRQSLMAETGALSGGIEFVDLLNGGMRSGKSRMFTYVLKPDRLYIAETGADFFLDMNSKHAVSGAAAGAGWGRARPARGCHVRVLTTSAVPHARPVPADARQRSGGGCVRRRNEHPAQARAWCDDVHDRPGQQQRHVRAEQKRAAAGARSVRPQLCEPERVLRGARQGGPQAQRVRQHASRRGIGRRAAGRERLPTDGERMSSRRAALV